MSEQGTESATQLLIKLSKGNHGTVDLLLPLIYDEMRQLAANCLRRERPEHTLQPTALVHNAEKRGADFQKLALNENIDKAVERGSEIVALDRALEALAWLQGQMKA